jgi:8-oxo-dGTP pyrophosphatase MutT (NUDIX family)
MISFKEENKKFNFRVGAVIISSDKKKVLLHTIKDFGFYLLPGGRVEWMEFSKQAIIRELEEELNVKNINPRERLFLENFFKFKDVEFQEISNNFVVELEETNAFLEQQNQFCGVEGEKYIYKWVDIADIDNYVIKPSLLKDVIKNYNGAFEYIQLDERA